MKQDRDDAFNAATEFTFGKVDTSSTPNFNVNRKQHVLFDVSVSVTLPYDAG